MPEMLYRNSEQLNSNHKWMPGGHLPQVDEPGSRWRYELSMQEMRNTHRSEPHAHNQRLPECHVPPVDQAMSTLRALYQTHRDRFAEFARSFPDEGLQGPLLLDPPTYTGQRTKLLVVGQETGGWLDNYDDIDAQLKIYRDFNLGDKWMGPFWNITRKVESALGIDRCSCAWTNLNRFDHDGEPPTGAVLDAMPALDFLLREEIQILRPDVCIFYTNRKYDHRLTALYPEVQFADISGLPRGHFARLTHNELPPVTVRTPHPRTIRMKGWEEAFIAFIRSLSANDSNG